MTDETVEAAEVWAYLTAGGWIQKGDRLENKIKLRTSGRILSNSMFFLKHVSINRFSREPASHHRSENTRLTLPFRLVANCQCVTRGGHALPALHVGGSENKGDSLERKLLFLFHCLKTQHILSFESFISLHYCINIVLIYGLMLDVKIDLSLWIYFDTRWRTWVTGSFLDHLSIYTWICMH